MLSFYVIILFDFFNKPAVSLWSFFSYYTGRQKKLLLSGQIKGDPYRWTLLNPFMATKMLLSPTTFKGDRFELKNYIFNTEWAKSRYTEVATLYTIYCMPTFGTLCIKKLMYF